MTLDEAIARLRELNETVPTPPRLPTETEVAAAERELEYPFHPDFRKYLLQASDIVYDAMEPVTITDPDSHTHLQTVAEDAWEQMELPKKFLPICEDNGDYYCMNKTGEIVFWSADGGTDDKWPSLAAWIEEVWIGEAADDE